MLEVSKILPAKYLVQRFLALLDQDIKTIIKSVYCSPEITREKLLHINNDCYTLENEEIKSNLSIKSGNLLKCQFNRAATKTR